MSLAMQQLLISWILIGILLLPADRVGTLQAIIGLPAVLIMLLGGAIADSGDLRRSLIQVYMLAAILPLYLAGVTLYGELNIATVLPWGFGMGVAIAYSMPAQQALLNRVSRNRLQQAVSIAMGTLVFRLRLNAPFLNGPIISSLVFLVASGKIIIDAPSFNASSSSIKLLYLS